MVLWGFLIGRRLNFLRFHRKISLCIHKIIPQKQFPKAAEKRQKTFGAALLLYPAAPTAGNGNKIPHSEIQKAHRKFEKAHSRTVIWLTECRFPFTDFPEGSAQAGYKGFGLPEA